jgi:hypothetical protein
MLMRSAFSDYNDLALAAACAKVFAAGNVSACRWEMVLPTPTVRRLFKSLG